MNRFIDRPPQIARRFIADSTFSRSQGQKHRIPSFRGMSGIPPITAEIADIEAAYMI
jgi:hypothetical protein